MKLWRKLAAACGTVLVCAMLIFSAASLAAVKESLLSSAFSQAEEKQRALYEDFYDCALLYAKSGDSPAVRRSVLNYCFSLSADENAVLIADGETVYSYLDIEPEEYIPEPGYDLAQRAERAGSRHFLVTGSRLWLESYGICCYVYTVDDLSPIYESLAGLRLRFALIGAACTLAGLALIVFFVRRSTRPLTRLTEAAASIAAGNYAERAGFETNDEIGALSRSFDNMAAAVEKNVNELEATAARQRLFIGAVTHEFKTPLTAILLNAEALQSVRMDEPERQKALARIAAQGKWLEALVRRLLALFTARESAELAPVDLSELTERARESTAELLRKRGVALDIACAGGTIYGDMTLLLSALVNLIDNAAKASAPGQSVRLTARSGVIEVSDEGSGIPAEALAHVTEPFYTADKSRCKRQGGAGLGLALVREIADAHGARLAIESEPQRGTCVKLIFPVTKP